jgi:delta14-sterol reductase
MISSLALAVALVLAFSGVLFLGARFLPGPVYEGFPQPGGGTKAYKVNGLALWIGMHVVLIAGWFFGLSLAPLVEHFWSLFAVANGLAVAFTIHLYLAAKRHGAALRPGLFGLIKDLWFGAELNPTLFGVDLKVFAYQPSLIGLWLLNLAFAYAQHERTGALTPQMIGYQIFWWLYLTTHYWYERGVLSMWDVIAENFGFMLVWGDLALVPFFYSIAGWWLLDAEPMSAWAVAAIGVVHIVGLWIFRESNAQKDRFKRDRSARIWGRPAETLGGKLLVSGWWGIGRKLNYTGEIMVYTSFALTAGFASVVPYLLPIWLCCLLPHRAWRDEQRMRSKYGELWAEYTRKARFRMVPYLY